jgi:hypothetical protein
LRFSTAQTPLVHLPSAHAPEQHWSSWVQVALSFLRYLAASSSIRHRMLAPHSVSSWHGSPTLALALESAAGFGAHSPEATSHLPALAQRPGVYPFTRGMHRSPA